MTVFLDLFWLVAMVVLSPVIVWKLATVKRWRTGLLERFGFRLPKRSSDRPLIWVHAVSVGEVLAARPLVREIEAAFPGHDVAISTITSTGQEVAKKHFPGHLTFYYPIDMTWPVRRLLDAVRPCLIVLVELELWPTFLTTARREGIPIVVVNGRISERSARRYRLLTGRILTRPIVRWCAQNEEYAERFLGLGVPREQVLISGNLKYDTPALDTGGDPAAAAKEMRAKLGIAADAPVIVGGSTHPSEEKALLEAYNGLRKKNEKLRLVLAPRHMERLADVLADCAAAGVKVLRKTEIDSSGTGTGTNDDPVVVIDTMGELARVYNCADVVFVGGSLIPHGGQNMLEPAALGKPVLFGPNVRNFQAIASELLAAKGAEMIEGPQALEGALGRLLGDPAAARDMGERGRAFVERHRGAAKRTVEVLKEVVGATVGHGPAARSGGRFRGRPLTSPARV